LWETDQKMNLLARFSQCFLDGRNPDLIEHPVKQMLAQRVYGLALGFEDLNESEQLRHWATAGQIGTRRSPSGKMVSTLCEWTCS
jgi:hypothetical protein